MMHVVDSSGWLEYLIEGKNADFIAPLIHDSDHLVTPAICIYEVCKRVLLQFGEDRALDIIGSMDNGLIVDINRQIAIDAALLSNNLKLVMANSLILVTARVYNATLWTQDKHFQDVEGVRYIEQKL